MKMSAPPGWRASRSVAPSPMATSDLKPCLACAYGGALSGGRQRRRPSRRGRTLSCCATLSLPPAAGSELLGIKASVAAVGVALHAPPPQG